jgi:hypothetical protein
LVRQPGSARASFRHAGRRYFQDETVVPVRIPVPRPVVALTGQYADERECYLDYAWWRVGAITSSDELFYPRSLPQLIGPFLDGERLDEPLEWWP